MKLIAHRGLISGPNKNLENLPAQIRSSLDKGYDCEIDLWVFEDRFYLGHDGPQYNITRDFLDQPGLWIHAKHLPALHWLLSTELNYFWHESDKYTLTSHGYIWAYPGNIVTNKSVQVMPEMADPELNNLDWNCCAICSDWILKIQDMK